MYRVMALLVLAVMVVLIACGGGGAVAEDGEDQSLAAGRGTSPTFAIGAPAATPAPMVAAALAPEAAFAVTDSSGPGRGAATALQTAQRKVISSASVSVEVEVVQTAITDIRVIAESLGGFVEQLSSSGGPDHQRATMTIRVPQSRFFDALELIEALGEVQSQNLGSEDVSEQFIDLEARLQSSLREEESLLSLLERADTVTEILTIERELSRVRSDIERAQGQLNFLERRVELATITVSLFPPDEAAGEPPSAFLSIEVRDVTGTLEEVRGVVTALGGVLDRVRLSEQDGNESAELSLRVFTRDFGSMMDTLERQGRILSKELREGTMPGEGSDAVSKEPNARIDLSLLERVDSGNVTLIVAIAAPLGGVAAAALLGFAIYLAYRTGRRRGGAA